MENNIDRAAVLSYFTGKARENAAAALALLDASLVQGSWVPRASTKVRSALNKLSRVAKDNSRGLEGISKGLGYDHPNNRRVWEAGHCLYFGMFERALKVDLVGVTGPEAAYFRAYQDAFRPVAATCRLLDMTRPAPVFTSLGASALVTETLERLGAVKVAMCPIVFHQRTLKDGQVVAVGVLAWPEGTVFGASKHRGGGHCQACGHAIRVRNNWVPLVLTDRAGVPKALWVGRDCAKTLFGVSVSGVLEIEDPEERITP